MKFLVIIEGVPGGLPTPPEQFLPFAKAQWAWSRKMLETGKTEVAYGLADHAGGFMGGVGIAKPVSSAFWAFSVSIRSRTYRA